MLWVFSLEIYKSHTAHRLCAGTTNQERIFHEANEA